MRKRQRWVRRMAKRSQSDALRRRTKARRDRLNDDEMLRTLGGAEKSL